MESFVDPALEYAPAFTEPRWIVGGTYQPSPSLPQGITMGASNNNLALGYHEGRLYFAWRTAPVHFASPEARMHILSSRDMGRTWDHERTIAIGADVREPFFLSFQGKLRFYYVELGVNSAAFQPRQVWTIEKGPDGLWSEPALWGLPGEIPWEFKVRGGRAWVSSYHGNHYSVSKSKVAVELKFSRDGERWEPGDAIVYKGGVSEVAFDFDREGAFWAVTRNEDGDETGYGHHVVSAPAEDPWSWEYREDSDPERYDSPRMFRHGGTLYMIARRDVGGIFGKGYGWLPEPLRRLALWYTYWRRPKRTALYRIDREKRRVELVMDLPSAGDTAFASILRTGPDQFLVANYTSPLKYAHKSWRWGQVSPQGTQIYFTELNFAPVGRH